MVSVFFVVALGPVYMRGGILSSQDGIRAGMKTKQFTSMASFRDEFHLPQTNSNVFSSRHGNFRRISCRDEKIPR